MNKFEVQGKNFSRTWNLNREFRALLAPMAKEFGLTVEAFLTQWTLHKLPGQLPRRDITRDFSAPRSFKADTFQCAPATWKRLVRAAEFSEESLEDYIWRAVMGSVECVEDDMVFSPKTGRPIGDEMEFSKYELRSVRAPDLPGSP